MSARKKVRLAFAVSVILESSKIVDDCYLPIQDPQFTHVRLVEKMYEYKKARPTFSYSRGHETSRKHERGPYPILA